MLCSERDPALGQEVNVFIAVSLLRTSVSVIEAPMTILAPYLWVMHNSGSPAHPYVNEENVRETGAPGLLAVGS